MFVMALQLVRNKKLLSKGVAMHAYGVSIYYACTGITWAELSQMSAKVELVLTSTRSASSLIPKKLKR